MLTNGLRVDSINGDFTVQQVQATDDPSNIGKVDVILVGVKAWQVPESAEAMRPMIGPKTFIYHSLLPMELRARGQLQFGE